MGSCGSIARPAEEIQTTMMRPSRVRTDGVHIPISMSENPFDVILMLLDGHHIAVPRIRFINSATRLQIRTGALDSCEFVPL